MRDIISLYYEYALRHVSFTIGGNIMSKKNIKILMACAGVLLCIVALALFAAPFVEVGYYEITGFDCMDAYDDEFAGIASALAFTCFLIIFTAVVAIKTFMKQGDDVMEKKNAKICAGFFGLVAFVTFLLQCLTVVIMDGGSYVDLGGGAIASGVMVLLGTGASIASLFFSAEGSTASAAPASGKAAVNHAAPQKVDTEQLKALKDLLDSGVLTQEEFDVKKKEILGL